MSPSLATPYLPQRPCHLVSPLPKLPTLKHIVARSAYPAPHAQHLCSPFPILHSFRLHSKSPILAFIHSKSYPAALAFPPCPQLSLHRYTLRQDMCPSPLSSTLWGEIIEEVNQAKYLGVTLTSKQNCSTHIDVTTDKANSTLGFWGET